MGDINGVFKTVTFTVWGEPRGKQRPRFARRGTFVSTYTPKETVSAENDIRTQSIATKPKELIEGAIWLRVEVYKSVPKSFSKSKFEFAEARMIRPITKPDWDNYGKLVSDALNKVYWNDDSQIVSANIEKFYSSKPRLEISVSYQNEVNP